jgi:hypothetical protein
MANEFRATSTCTSPATLIQHAYSIENTTGLVPPPEDAIVVWGVEVSNPSRCSLPMLNAYIHFDILQACSHTYYAAVSITTTHTPLYQPWKNICDTVLAFFRPVPWDATPLDIGEDFVKLNGNTQNIPYKPGTQN